MRKRPEDHLENLGTSPPEHRHPTWLSDIVWTPLVAGGLLLMVGVISLVLDQLFLFPSLGPTSYLLARAPEQSVSRFYNVIVGHLVGLASGFLAVGLLGLWQTQTISSAGHVDPVRVLAAVLALVFTVTVATLLHASHPPAGATTLLVALGALNTGQDALHLMVGVLVIATLGEPLRRIRTGELRVIV